MTKRDIIIIIVILAAAMALGLFNRYFDSAGKEYLTVSYNNEVIQKIKLPANKIITIEKEKNKWILEIEGQKARVAQAHCPGKDCVKQGWISAPGEALICVPQKFIAQFEEESGIDACTQ
ncbi:MAG: NusG domain II-containing protein [Elusimicrobiota bacterium]|nr:NusG domain II-containing protein [Elusimicrobiota bacterium]